MPDITRLFARLLATIAARDGLRPLSRGGVARVVERASRLVDDATKLSIHERTIGDFLREADGFAAGNGHETITRADVQQAIDAQTHRADRVGERIFEEIRRGTLLIDTAIAKLGQVNGLVVGTLGNFTFGRPVRITAGIRLGRGEVVDIERESRSVVRSTRKAS
jgi:predicted ATP-dependent protease